MSNIKVTNYLANTLRKSDALSSKAKLEILHMLRKEAEDIADTLVDSEQKLIQALEKLFKEKQELSTLSPLDAIRGYMVLKNALSDGDRAMSPNYIYDVLRLQRKAPPKTEDQTKKNRIDVSSLPPEDRPQVSKVAPKFEDPLSLTQLKELEEITEISKDPNVFEDTDVNLDDVLSPQSRSEEDLVDIDDVLSTPHTADPEEATALSFKRK